jgi:hypothetical protein
MWLQTTKGNGVMPGELVKGAAMLQALAVDNNYTPAILASSKAGA